MLLNHGDKVTFGGQELEAVETPGHTAGITSCFSASSCKNTLKCVQFLKAAKLIQTPS